MGLRAKPEELREMLKVARKLRTSAEQAADDEYRSLFLRAAAALEDRAALLAYHPSDLELEEEAAPEETFDPALYRHVDVLC